MDPNLFPKTSIIGRAKSESVRRRETGKKSERTVTSSARSALPAKPV